MRTTMAFAYTLAAVMLASAGAAAQTPPRNRDPGPPTPFPSPVFRTDSVARFLALEDRQVDALNQLTAGLQDRYRASYDDIAVFRGEEYAQKRSELDQRYVRDWIGGARLLMDDMQFSRYLRFLEGYGRFDLILNPPQPPPAEARVAPTDLRESPGTLPEPSSHRPYHVPPEK